MLKYFCDKCEKEIKDGDIHRVELPRRVVSKVGSHEGVHPDHDKPHDWYQTYVVTRCKNAAH